MSIRAKFQVVSVTQHAYSPAARTVRLEPRYDVTVPEDQRFHDSTPSGTFEMHVNNPAAIEQLVVGRAFYIDLVPAG